MVRENEIIEKLICADLKGEKSLELKNCIINSVDFDGAFQLHTKITIESCIIFRLNIHSCWFVNGLVIRNSIVKGFVDYQMGGHNINSIIIEGNIFREFLNFFDCHFESRIEVRNNIFLKGTNLLGNLNEGFANRFLDEVITENNIGDIDSNGVFPPVN